MNEHEQVRQQLARAEDLLDCFQKALSHELPNQLVAIQGLLRLLELEGREQLGREGLDYLSRVIAAARRTHELVRALAELGRVAPREETTESVSLADAVREAAAEVFLLFPRCPIEYDFPESGPTLAVAGPALRRVLVHLLRNAAQAGSGDQTVRVQVGARPTDEGVEFWVADDGPGMSLEQQQQLFNPFNRRERPDAGNGLGLFLVRHIVESWGGTLRVKSEPGRGSTFTVVVRSR